jgi:hypothetical protein
MKTKAVLITGLTIALILIVFSIAFGVYDHEVKQDYRNSMDHAIAMGKSIKEPALKSYAISTRWAGVGVGFLSLILLACAVKSFRQFKENRILYISHVLYLVFIGISFLFVFVLLTSTGAVSFDETYILWVILGLVSVVQNIVSMKKLPQMTVTA